ncbi:MAG: VOC family protein [Lentimicrobium sp.]|nr:VOC family protein [Lentimicrobium sp.]
MKLLAKYLWIGLLVLLTNTQLRSQSISAVNSVSITISNMDEAIEFYTRVLPFQKDTLLILKGKNVQQFFNIQDTSLTIEIARLHLGEEQIELMEFHSVTDTGRKIPTDSQSNDLWFQHIAIVVSDMDKAYQLLLDNDVTHVSTFPQTLPDYLSAAAGISAFYFRDPDGHNLELIHFPEGKGNPKWQNNGDKLFLGIDHTAIGIESTKASLKFYKDILGLDIAGESENYGSEQEHLNQVFGARLQITGLTAGSGIGLEFLDYIAPPGGRPYPADTKATDIWYWHTSLKVNDAEMMYNKILATDARLISTGIINFNSSETGIHQGFIISDPDGHALFIND